MLGHGKTLRKRPASSMAPAKVLVGRDADDFDRKNVKADYLILCSNVITNLLFDLHYNLYVIFVDVSYEKHEKLL